MNSHTIKLLISCMLLLAALVSNAQQDIGLDGPKVYRINRDQDREVELPVSFRSPGNFTGDLFVTVPQALDFAPVLPGNPTVTGGSQFQVLSVNRQTVPGSTNKRIKVRFIFTASGTNVFGVLTVRSLRFPLSKLCGDTNYRVTADLKDTLGVLIDKDSAMYTLQEREARINLNNNGFSAHNCRDPFFHTFYVSSWNLSGPLKATYLYNASQFTVAGVFTNGFPQQAVAYTPTANPGEFTIDNAYGEYKVYLRPINCVQANNQSFTVSVKTLEEQGCPKTQSFTQVHDTLNTTCCLGEGAGIPRPYIENDHIKRCAGECSQIMYVSINNFTATAYSNLVYDLNLPSDATIDNIYPNPGGTISAHSYHLTVSLAAGAVHSFTVFYKITEPSGTPLPASTLATQTLKSSSLTTLYDSKGYTMPYSTNCNPSILITESAIKGVTLITGDSNPYTLKNDSVQHITAYLAIYRYDPYPITGFDFEYRLNDYLKLDPAVTPTYAYSGYGNPNTKTYSSSNPHIAGAVTSSDYKKIKFQGINFPLQCPTDSLLFIKIGLISYSQLEADKKFNQVVRTDNNSQTIYVFKDLVPWVAFGEPLVSLYVSPQCDSLNFPVPETSFSVAPDVPFYYSYVFDNRGATTTTGVMMVGSLPHIGDKLISIPATARNSTLTFPCPSPSDITVLVQRSLNGATTNTILPATSYDLVFSTLGNICSEELADPAHVCTTPPGTCDGTKLFFKLKLKSTYGGLKAFTKLVLRMKVNIPAGTPVGLKGRGSFAGAYTQVKFVQESTIGEIIVNTTSPCTPKPPCIECENSFAPVPGKSYVLSAWVKEANMPGALTYAKAGITLSFKGATSSQNTTLPIFRAKGDIIDGWQQIEAVFTVPANAVKIGIRLKNSGTGEVFFDDIRIHPFDSNMKSFVYDPKTLRLSAELDERNYATFYEYNEEGALVRVKKETARGVMTIKESRNATRKE